MTSVLVQDKDVSRDLMRKRKELRLDRYDEVWDGVYVMPTVPDLEHQEMVLDLGGIHKEVSWERGGKVYPGANVTDRVKNWKDNFRVPDVVVVLKGSRAKKRKTHIYWGPDFLTEIRSPDEDPEVKIPFYSSIEVQELLIVDRDSREVKLFRHGGNELALVEPALFEGERWLVSEVLPLAFRKSPGRGRLRLEVRRTDDVSRTRLV